MAILRFVISVDFKASHVLLKFCLLLCFFFSLLLLLILGFLLSLDSSELIEHILVVQDRVREFIFEVLLVQQSCDSLLDEVDFKDLVDAWPL